MTRNQEIYDQAIELIAITMRTAMNFKEMTRYAPEAQEVVDHYLVRATAMKDMTSLLFDVSYEEIDHSVDQFFMGKVVA